MKSLGNFLLLLKMKFLIIWNIYLSNIKAMQKTFKDHPFQKQKTRVAM